MWCGLLRVLLAALRLKERRTVFERWVCLLWRLSKGVLTPGSCAHTVTLCGERSIFHGMSTMCPDEPSTVQGRKLKGVGPGARVYNDQGTTQGVNVVRLAGSVACCA